ncbi:MAG: 50S ribosomal protein L11 methyltransferase [Oceanococcaceae bacterium]
MTEWQELTLRTAHPEALGEILEACGALAVTFKDAADDPVLEPLPGQTPLWPDTLVVGLFDGTDNRAQIEESLHRGGGEWIVGAHWDELPEQVWERAWLAHFRPMNFGDRLRVAPHDATVPDDGRVTLRLDPGLAFGTGTHPTTALCLHWLGSQDLRGRRVLDYGCGSGILAVASARLGAIPVVACDIDPQAEQATRDNALRNGVDVRIVPCIAPVATPFDIVIANILAGTLISLADPLVARLQRGGQLLLSGLLCAQAAAVRAAYPALDFTELTQDGWSLLVGVHKSHD